MHEHPHRKLIRRLVLPSGQPIEVVLVDPQKSADHALHVCPECCSPLVQPVRWREASRGLCALTLHCPNCYWMTDGLFSRQQVNHLEEQLDHGLTEMLSDLRRLADANLAEEIDRFAAALQAELILPEDF